MNTREYKEICIVLCCLWESDKSNLHIQQQDRLFSVNLHDLCGMQRSADWNPSLQEQWCRGWAWTAYTAFSAFFVPRRGRQQLLHLAAIWTGSCSSPCREQQPGRQNSLFLDEQCSHPPRPHGPWPRCSLPTCNKDALAPFFPVRFECWFLDKSWQDWGWGEV